MLAPIDQDKASSGSNDSTSILSASLWPHPLGGSGCRLAVVGGPALDSLFSCQNCE